MLRYRIDILPLLHVIVALGLLGLSMAHSLWWTPLAIFVAAHVMAIEHNHAHVSIFRSRLGTSIADLAMLLACGIPLIFWRVHHLGSHHQHVWTDSDWSSPFNFRHAEAPHKPVGYHYYQWTYYPLFAFHSTIHVLRSQNPRLVRELLLNGLVLASVTAALIAQFGILRWLVVVAPTYLLAGLMLGAVNYFEHFSTHDHGDRFLAWTFTCRIHNLLSYNSGYHQLHHVAPSMHWSELPVEHARDDSYCPADLLETGRFPGYRSPRARNRWFQEHRGPRGANHVDATAG